MVDRQKVEKVLGEIRPALQADGGDVELVDVTEDGFVKVRLRGACSGCPFSQMTLSHRIGKYIQKEVPEVKEVVAVP